MTSRWLPDLQVRSTGEGTFSTSVSVGSASPWFEGHFPGKPILPGLGLLAVVLHAAREAVGRPELGLAKVPKLRFKGVVLPNEGLDVTLAASPADGSGSPVDFRFQVERKGEEVCVGRLTLAEGGRT